MKQWLVALGLFVGLCCVGVRAEESKPVDKDGEMIKKDADATAPPPQPARKKGEKVERVKYAAATPEQHEKAIADAKSRGQEVAEKLGIKFATVETDHFIIFTDWDKREHNFLKQNLENAYRVVSKQFDMSTKDNIFVGKLPVYMFAKYADFSRFAKQLDGFDGIRPTVAGYYMGRTDGSGHMSMWKPDHTLTGNTSIKDAERKWAYVLTHEFTHAFLARYRTNEFIPRWLNEGIAEVIASSEFPDNDRYILARTIAIEGSDVSFLFDDENMPGGRHYPVMQSMVELLVKTDRKRFIKLIDDIKDGVEPEEALQKHFKTNYANFAPAWREWAKRQAGR